MNSSGANSNQCHASHTAFAFPQAVLPAAFSRLRCASADGVTCAIEPSSIVKEGNIGKKIISLFGPHPNFPHDPRRNSLRNAHAVASAISSGCEQRHA
ncbi:hypothetical protein V5799_025348 [Amblyomma americanum]|uniref:Uncharacterized protein n=1 Tax=Amblyomma americanum TaxID=6943 RepID=A0AAQ4E9U6_AMBAM